MQIGLERQARQRFICVISQLDGVITASITTGNGAAREVQVSCAQPWKVLIMLMMMLRLPPKRDAAGCLKLDIPLKCSIIDCSNGGRAWDFINLHVRPIFVTQFECQKVKFQTKTQNTHTQRARRQCSRQILYVPAKTHNKIFIFITVRDSSGSAVYL